MTWLTGSTTWAALSQDITRLLCGEMADGAAVTNATGSRWIREVSRVVTDGVLATTTALTSATAAFVAADVGSRVIGTGIPANTVINSITSGTAVVMSNAATATATAVSVRICTDTIRTPASVDVATGVMSMRAGYWTAYGGGSATLAQTTAATADPSTSGFHRWLYRIRVSSVNTVAGNYSTATFSCQGYDADTGAALVNTSLGSSSAGVITGPNGMTLTVADPSGILAVNTTWRRGFTATYMYGIDYWPMYARRSGTATFGTAPGGTTATDWDVVEQITSTATEGSFERGGLFHGLGIKTSTGLAANAIYTVGWSMALLKARIFATTTAGTLGLDIGNNSIKDTVNTTNTMRVQGSRTQTWCKMFQTAGSVAATTAVQYWISVTATGVAIALRGDSGFSGKLGTAYFGTFIPYDTTRDLLPTMFNGGFDDLTVNTGGSGGQMTWERNYFRNRRSVDASEGGRDWQTGWMRSDFVAYNTYALGGGDVVANYTAAPIADITSTDILSAVGYATYLAGYPSYNPARQDKPSPVDGKWWLYGFQWSEVAPLTTPGTADERRLIRGTTNIRFFFVPGDGWGSGDELTDVSTGAKYLLLAPDYPGIVGRANTTTSTWFGGVAIAEL